MIATIGVGSSPYRIGVNPQTNRIYVSCPPDGTVWVLHDEGAGVEEFILNPQVLSLNVNPNPFNKSTNLILNIPADSKRENVEFLIYDVSGRMVKTFSNINSSSSPVTLTWDGKADSGEHLSSGLYFGVLSIGEKAVQKKMIMIR